MGLWVLAILTVLLHSTVSQFNRTYWGLENEALIVSCSVQARDLYPVDWYYSKTNEIITTQERSRVFASGERLKFLPSQVSDSGTYTCTSRRPTRNMTGYVTVTIRRKPSDCNIPGYLMYSPTSGVPENSRIYCPTIDNYNWTAPVQWFKNCKILQGRRYYLRRDFLQIQNATSADAGDYTCKFMHNENGVNYTVTATRPFSVKGGENFSLLPVIRAPLHNDIVEVEMGKSASITCSACIGKGSRIWAAVQWRVNGSSVSDLGEKRIYEEKGQNQSSSKELTCLNQILIISDVKEEDLSLRYDCLAYTIKGLKNHSIRLRQKNPIDRQSIYYTIAGFSILLILICVLVIMLKVFWIDLILLWRDIAKPYKTRDDGKLYDAYVVYPRNYKSRPGEASSVEYFVHQILPDVLENKCGYNLCIYGRDLLPGEDAITTVETKIQKSRRHIFILTPRAMESQEFAYEQEIALHSALIQNDSKVILIEMEALSEADGVQAGELQDSLQHLMKVQGTIKWWKDHVASTQSLNTKFWKHVRYQMPAPNKLPKKTLSLTCLSAHVQECLL
ncbi:interleukin-1 receptor-like 1 [Dasypus novemcinctus]|uniref:interleukin-1 receptor-like 1 n=1 Tax=Dasypus novemcinctus TaxID=9361 RepID=UPI00265DC9C6|nr:interleukin-1 receptor-like 1 [Dasypus novemcinctus]XP_012381348.2 interleukin-1 receptor-like 1 [Dasypus novemcinctus]XP_058134235.1 interleukin-1 receptor-like 1 [Dasypus novemcinctus]XP_058134237.1 interleukin-1 receptor-like 1 [Dasypus novemcinctus]